MYKKILVPLDGSELSGCSLEHVKQAVAAGGPTEVILLQVIEPVTPSIGSAWSQAGYTISEVQNKIKQEAKNFLDQIVDVVSKQGISARSEVIEGRAAESILDYAQKNQVDLIIMSSHGRSGISRWAFGSVSDRVARHSTIPVLIITPPGCRINPE
jgi:nucleotide-binding universal stress UspA family protein